MEEKVKKSLILAIGIVNSVARVLFSSCGCIVGIMNQSCCLSEQFLLMDFGNTPEELYSTASHQQKKQQNGMYTH